MKINFSVKIPDELYIDNFSSNKTMNLVYDGPDKHLVLINKETGDFVGTVNTPEDPYNKDFFEVLTVEASKNPEVAYYLLHRVDPIERGHVTETLPGNLTFEAISNPTIYDYFYIRYDVENKSWKMPLVTRLSRSPLNDMADRYRTYIEENASKATTNALKTLMNNYLTQLDDFEKTGIGSIPSWKLTEIKLDNVPKPPLELVSAFNVIPS